MNVVPFRRRHVRASTAEEFIPKSEGSTFFLFRPKAFDRTRYNSAGIRPRDRQLLTADAREPVSLATADVPPSSSMSVPTERIIAAECSRNVNKSSLHNLAIVTACELALNRGMARSLKDVSNRLKMTASALDLTAAELCRRSGIKPNQWSQFINPEKKRRITVDAALKLRDEFGLTLDWIYDGDPSGLPNAVAQKLRKAA